jgi:hypothetical protein
MEGHIAVQGQSWQMRVNHAGPDFQVRKPVVIASTNMLQQNEDTNICEMHCACIVRPINLYVRGQSDSLRIHPSLRPHVAVSWHRPSSSSSSTNSNRGSSSHRPRGAQWTLHAPCSSSCCTLPPCNGLSVSSKLIYSCRLFNSIGRLTICNHNFLDFWYFCVLVVASATST